MRVLIATSVATSAALLGIACVRPMHAVGVSGNASGAEGRVRVLADGGVTDAAPPRESPIPQDFRQTMKKMDDARLTSNGHAAGRWDVQVWGDDAAMRGLAEGSRAYPAGARFVEEHFERAEGGRPGPVMMMEKLANGSWRYVAVGANGDVAVDGVVESCAGCHGDAPGDHVFRVVGRDAGK